MIESISIIGSGNVAWHFAKIFSEVGYEVLEICGRNPKEEAAMFEELTSASYISDIDDLSDEADAYLICVNDDAIQDVLDQLPFEMDEDQFLLHTSGAVPSTILMRYAERYGCFWPVQTLTKQIEIESDEMPIIITASDDFTAGALISLAEQISDHFEVTTDDKKEKLHLAAVMVNNFSNHIFALTQEFCINEDIDFKLLSSLLVETALKTKTDTLLSASQTGPARRNDKTTIESQLIMLENYPQMYKLYCTMTESIHQKYHHK